MRTHTIWKYIFMAAVLVIMLEILLRLTGVYRTYTEIGGGNFLAEYEREYDSWIFTFPPDHEWKHQTTEFDFTCRTNSSGFRDQEWPDMCKTDGELTVVLVGDSFVAGVGSNCSGDLADHFSTLMDVPVYNAGVSGSDIFYAFEVIQELILPRSPDIVLLGINNSDIYEYLTRGGFERFQQDNRVTHRKSPVSLKLYERWHVYRFYIHDIRRLERYTFLSRREEQQMRLEAEQAIANAVVRTDSLTQAHDTRLIVFFYPIPGAVSEQMPDPEIERIYSMAGSEGVDAVLLTQDFLELAGRDPAAFNALFWPQDGHYNTEGYREFAHILVSALDARYPSWSAAASTGKP